MSAIKKGSAVKQVMPAPIKGIVAGYRIDPETGRRQTEVAFADEEGEITSVFFFDEQIEADAEAQAALDDEKDAAAEE